MRAGAISCSAGAISGPSARRKRHGRSPAAKARAAFDLAIMSVLLDAGAGPAWRYRDPATGHVVSPLRRAWRREPAHVRGRRVLGRSAPIRCGRRRAADASQPRRARGRLSEHDRQSAGRPRRPRRLARRLGAAVAARPRSVRARGSRAAGRALRSSGGAGRGRPPRRRRASSKRCSNISGRSGRAG